jgi:hypothetical protein
MEDKISELETNIGRIDFMCVYGLIIVLEEVIARDTLLDDAIEELSWHKRFKEACVFYTI